MLSNYCYSGISLCFINKMWLPFLFKRIQMYAITQCRPLCLIMELLYLVAPWFSNRTRFNTSVKERDKLHLKRAYKGVGVCKVIFKSI